MKTITFAATAAKELDALPRQAQDRIMDALTGYSLHGTGDIKQLNGRQGYRLRIGSDRVIFNEDQTTILAIYVGTRATDTYKRN